MRALLLTNTAYDLIAGSAAAGATEGMGSPAPFQPNYTVVILNVTGGSLVVQECDTVAGSYTTLATVVPGATEVTLNKQFIKVSTAANVFLLGN